MDGTQSALFLIYITISFLLDMSSIILNGLIAYVLKKHNKTRIVTFWFIYCLSISDVMVGVTGLTFHSSLFAFKWNSSWVSISGKLVKYFLETSGHLIFIVAVDRCIHMKYLNKYSTLMNQSRARLIVLLNITFCAVATTPYFVASEKFNALFELGLTIFHATLIASIYFIYLKTYSSIRRQIAALQISKRNTMPYYNKAEKRLECQDRVSTTQHCSFEVDAKMRVVHDSEKESHRPSPCLPTKDAAFLERQGDPIVVSTCSETIPISPFLKEEKYDVVRTTANLSCFLKSDVTSSVTGIDIERDEVKAAGQCTIAQTLEVGVFRQLHKRRATPEQEFRKAIIFIFLALFICYFPIFFCKFYQFASKEKNSILSVASFTGLMLNSSLNAIILIAFNKEMKKNLKSIF